MKLKCKNKKCHYSWEYKGKSKFYATCPRCLQKVRIKDGKKKDNLCIDCGKFIHRFSTRCHSCAKRGRFAPKWKGGISLIQKYCIDCGKKVTKGSRLGRCNPCSKKGKLSSSYGTKRPHTKKWKREQSKCMLGRNNPFYGKKHTEESRRKISLSKIGKEQPKGKKSPSWKGDSVGYFGLHIWLRKYKLRVEFCEECGKKTKKLEISNISKKYKRDFDDYNWLCKSCHAKRDGMGHNFRKSVILKPTTQKFFYFTRKYLNQKKLIE